MAAFLIALLILSISVVVLIRHVRGRKKRRMAYRAVADGLGWRYVERDADLIAPHKQLPLFSTGKAHPAENVMRGEFAGRHATVFEFAYTAGGGDGASTMHQTIVHVQGSTAQLPVFEIRPEVKLMDRLIRAFGYQDIEIAHRPEFTRRFVLRGPDEGAIRAIFTDRVIDAFEAQPSICVQAYGPHLFLYRMGEVVMPDALPERLTAASDLLRTFEEEQASSDVRESPPALSSTR